MEHEVDPGSAVDSSQTVSRTNEYVLLNDLPVDKKSEAMLHLRDASTRIAQMLRTSAEKSPFVVAVDAAWGMGKSTLLKLVREELGPGPERQKSPTDRPLKTLWFNAWTAEGGDALAGLIKSVLLELDPNIVRRTLRKLAQHEHLIGAARIIFTVAASFFGMNRLVDELWTRLSMDSQSRNKLRDNIEVMLMSWIDESPKDVKRRMVVFIDDLDRCSDDVVVQVCEALKLYLDVPGLIFVLACDQSVLAQGVKNPARGGTDEGRLYLEKIVQVQYRLPPPDDTAIGKLIEGYATESGTQKLIKDEVETTLLESNCRNPRKIKRIINSFILEHEVDETWQARPLKDQHLLIAVLLQHLYTKFYDLLISDESSDPLNKILSAEFPELAGNESLMKLLGSLDEPDIRPAFLKQLRRRPLATGPTDPVHEDPVTLEGSGDFVMVVYRGESSRKGFPDGHPTGETGESDDVHLEADRKWWRIAEARQPYLRAVVYVEDGTVERIRAVDPNGQWIRDGSYVDIPLTPPLDNDRVDAQFPTLFPDHDIRLGSQRAHVRGKLREYLPL